MTELQGELEQVDRSRWTAEAAAFADHNYRQSWDFGVRAAKRVGAVSEHVAIRDGSRTIGLADVRIKSLPLVGGGIAYVNGGPLTRLDKRFDAQRFVSVADALRREYASRRGMVLRILPPIGPATWNLELSERLEQAGFRRTDAARAYRTILLDIDRPLDEVRAGLHPRWRNHLNRAGREGLTIRIASDVQGMREFAALFDEFVVRKGFDVDLGIEFYEAVQQDLPAAERYVVVLAERDGRTIAGHVSSMIGDTSVYLLGATSPEALKCKAAYLVHWREIELSQERGCTWHDLGGIDPEANPGVYHYKQRLRGDDVTAAGPVEWYSGPRARLALFLEARYRALRTARKQPSSSPPRAGTPDG